jgi:hypothetical protein
LTDNLSRCSSLQSKTHGEVESSEYAPRDCKLLGINTDPNIPRKMHNVIFCKSRCNDLPVALLIYFIQVFWSTLPCFGVSEFFYLLGFKIIFCQ